MADPNIPNLEPRVAVLEQIAADTRTTLVDLRDEMRALRTEMRDEMRALRTEMREDMRATTDRLDRRMETLEKRQHTDFLWLLAIMIGGYASMLGVMAHGFKWI